MGDKMKIREYLKENKLLSDGGFGTYYTTLVNDDSIPEKANILNPDLVKKIHMEYINSGAKLISDEAISTLKEELLPIAEVITPNIPETEVLTDMEVKTVEDMEIAAKKIYDTYHCAVLVKGGHQLNDANDYLYNGEKGTWFKGHRIDNSNTHGTGCTLSSAIASNLAKGYTLEESVRHAKTYLSGAIGAMLDLGQGSGPMDHGYNI